MPSRDPGERSAIARIAALELHASHDAKLHTEPARAGFLERFLRMVDEADPDLPQAERARRAERLLRAHMQRLALKSARARRARRS